MKYAHRITVSCALVVVFLTSSGCLYSREIQNTRHAIERANPDLELDRQLSANVGPVSLRFARWITSRVDDADANRASKYLRDMRRVKAGVYDVRRPTEKLEGLSELRRFRGGGWELAARVADDEDNVWLYYREKRGGITDIYAIAYSEDELVIAHVSGRLTRMFEEVLRDHARWTDFADVGRADFWNN